MRHLSPFTVVLVQMNGRTNAVVISRSENIDSNGTILRVVCKLLEFALYAESIHTVYKMTVTDV